MKKNKIGIGISILLLMFFIVACGNEEKVKEEQEKERKKSEENLTAEGMPIVNEPITLDFFTAKSNVNLPVDWNDLMMWNKYAELTNVKVNWVEQVSMDSLAEKRNLALVGERLPDVFYAADLSNVDLFNYGQQGTFIELNDLIEKHAPNLNKLIEENPDIKKGLTFPNGKIYSLPSLRDEAFLSIRIGAIPWFNKVWLDKFEMDIPETTEDFYAYLKAVKEQDPNGNGQADEIPYGGVNIDDLADWLKGSFGLGHNGDGHIDKDPEGEGLRFIPTSERYKELLEFLNKLYKEELIQQNIFSIEWDQYMAAGAEGKYGSTLFWDPSRTFASDDQGDEYVGAAALKGPHGDQMYSSVLNPMFSIGGFALTRENANPAATVRWLDYFYSDEGARLLYMGVEGETYEEKDGAFKYLDEILNSDDRNQAISNYLPWVGVNPPGIVKQDYFIGAETSPATLEVSERIRPFVPEELWSKFTYDEEESKFLASVGVDIEKYVKEMRDKFISGDTSFEEWDNYVKTLEDIGVEKYLEINEAAYERYSAN